MATLSFVKDEKTKKYLFRDCEHQTTLKKDIKNHYANMHGPTEERRVAELCGGRVFNTKWEYERHQEAFHRPEKCISCGFKFKDKQILKAHRRNIKERNLPCPVDKTNNK